MNMTDTRAPLNQNSD